MAIKVPASFPITMTDIWAAVNDHTSTASKSLALCYANSISGYFDPTYYVADMTMGRFRNYGPSISATLPTVTTSIVVSITSTTATTGGNVTSDGGATVTARGVCWGTSLNPTISNTHTSDGTGIGSFTSYMTSLTSSTTYYVRAYATNSVGTSYGNNESFVPTSVSNSGYGKLYNQYAVTDSRNMAASGWRIPSKGDLDALILAVGGTTVAGGYLKETGTTHWKTPNTGASNNPAFTSVGSGIRDADPATIKLIQEWQEIWSTDYHVVMVIQYNTATAYTGTNVPFNRGCSIRLVKDNSTLTGYTGNDGKTYATIKIGTQVWMAENLRETKYRNGDDIPQVADYTAWNSLVTGAWCWFNNDSRYE